MSAHTHRDIEVRIDDCDETALLAVLRESLGDFHRDPSFTGEAGSMAMYAFADAQLFLQRADDGTHSVMLHGTLPWPHDVALAQHLFSRLKKRIVCDPGSSYPEVHPLSDLFLQIDANGERIIHIGDIDQDSDEDVDASKQP
jgi:hypothetical protein